MDRVKVDIISGFYKGYSGILLSSNPGKRTFTIHLEANGSIVTVPITSTISRKLDSDSFTFEKIPDKMMLADDGAFLYNLSDTPFSKDIDPSFGSLDEKASENNIFDFLDNNNDKVEKQSKDNGQVYLQGYNETYVFQPSYNIRELRSQFPNQSEKTLSELLDNIEDVCNCIGIEAVYSPQSMYKEHLSRVLQLIEPQKVQINPKALQDFNLRPDKVETENNRLFYNTTGLKAFITFDKPQLKSLVASYFYFYANNVGISNRFNVEVNSFISRNGVPNTNKNYYISCLIINHYFDSKEYNYKKELVVFKKKNNTELLEDFKIYTKLVDSMSQSILLMNPIEYSLLDETAVTGVQSNVNLKINVAAGERQRAIDIKNRSESLMNAAKRVLFTKKFITIPRKHLSSTEFKEYTSIFRNHLSTQFKNRLLTDTIESIMSTTDKYELRFAKLYHQAQLQNINILKITNKTDITKRLYKNPNEDKLLYGKAKAFAVEDNIKIFKNSMLGLVDWVVNESSSDPSDIKKKNDVLALYTLLSGKTDEEVITIYSEFKSLSDIKAFEESKDTFKSYKIYPFLETSSKQLRELVHLFASKTEEIVNESTNKIISKFLSTYDSLSSKKDNNKYFSFTYNKIKNAFVEILQSELNKRITSGASGSKTHAKEIDEIKFIIANYDSIIENRLPKGLEERYKEQIKATKEFYNGNYKILMVGVDPIKGVSTNNSKLAKRSHELEWEKITTAKLLENKNVRKFEQKLESMHLTIKKPIKRSIQLQDAVHKLIQDDVSKSGPSMKTIEDYSKQLEASGIIKPVNSNLTNRFKKYLTKVNNSTANAGNFVANFIPIEYIKDTLPKKRSSGSGSCSGSGSRRKIKTTQEEELAIKATIDDIVTKYLQ